MPNVDNKPKSPKIAQNAAALHSSSQAKFKTNTHNKPTPAEPVSTEGAVQPLPRTPGLRGK
jgi:hypothetical protein